MRQIADRAGTDDFFVMEGDTLENTGRALELLGEMERRGRYSSFQLFSSAESIRASGLDNTVRLGVSFVWVGVASATSAENLARNEGVVARGLIGELRDRGIRASSPVFRDGRRKIASTSGNLCRDAA